MNNFVTGAVSWFGGTFGKEIVDKARGKLVDEWRLFKWKEAEDIYRASLMEQYSHIHLLGYPKKIEISKIFTHVYVLDEISARKHYSEDIENQILQKGNRSFPYKKRWPLHRLSEKDKRLYLLGKPGAGKTTLLRYLIMQACLGKITQIPIYVDLKDWVAPDTQMELISYIAEKFKECKFPNAENVIQVLLKKGQALVLFDGLDEVKQEGDLRKKVIIKLKNFAHEYQDIHICLTCRVAASDYDFDNFKYLEIADFDDTQVKIFTSNWFQNDLDKQKRFLDELNEVDELEQEGLKEFTKTPLLLALLCLFFDQTGKFPSNRVILYQTAFQALLEGLWDRSRGISRDGFYRNLSYPQKKALLTNVAYENFEKGIYFFRKSLLVQQIAKYLTPLSRGNENLPIDGESVLRDMQAHHGILIEQSSGIYSFLHLTFQEYLTACYIVESHKKSMLEHLITEHLTDNRWREVFLMIAGIPENNASDFFKMFLQANINILRDEPSCLELMHLIKPYLRSIGAIKIEVAFLLVILNIIKVSFDDVNLDDVNLDDVNLDNFRSTSYAQFHHMNTLAEVLSGILLVPNFIPGLISELQHQLLSINSHISTLYKYLDASDRNDFYTVKNIYRSAFSAIQDVIKCIHIIQMEYGISISSDEINKISLEKIKISSKQIPTFYSYFQTIRLLLDCLKLTTEQVRKDILSRILELPHK
jgi:hypothetical protein